MIKPQRRVFSDLETLVRAVGLQLDETLETDVANRGEAHLVLTGGTVGIELLKHVGRAPRALPWQHIHIWWGDERFVEAGSAQRNDEAADRALLDRIDIPPANVHRMAAARGGVSLDDAARSYAHELERYFGVDFPCFDITLLGLGPDMHVASLFPHADQLVDIGHTVVAVPNAPKPPPGRISLSLPSINASRRVWVVAAGVEKANAVAEAFTKENEESSPISFVRGREETVFYLDEDANGPAIP